MASVVAGKEDLRAHDVTQWMRDDGEKCDKEGLFHPNIKMLSVFIHKYSLLHFLKFYLFFFMQVQHID